MNRVEAQSSLFCANFKLFMRYNGFAVKSKLFKDDRCVYKYTGSSHLNLMQIEDVNTYQLLYSAFE